MNPDHAVFFLNRSENKMIFGPVFSPAAPFHLVVAQPAAKVTSVELIENRAQVEVFSFLAQIKLSLHRQRAIRDFPFCFLRHNWGPRLEGLNSKWVQTGRQEKRPLFLKISLIALTSGACVFSSCSGSETGWEPSRRVVFQQSWAKRVAIFWTCI